MTTGALQPLNAELYRDLVRATLAEDLGGGDVTTETLIDRQQLARATLLARVPCVIAGLDVATEAFRQLDPGVAVTVHHPDGSRVDANVVVADFRGYAGPMLTAERTALNFVQRLSGVATVTRRFVDAAAGRITILDTRKTTPMLRALEKYAVRAGGGTNHRFGLADGILIKDNHIQLGGGVRRTVTAMKQANRNMPTEVEVETLAELDEALAAGADIVLLDNMSTADITEAVRRCRGKAKTEISGGVTLARIPELAATGADYVSVGALTHSAPAIDLSLEIQAV